MITCPRCGQTARPDAGVCPRCGTPLAPPAPGGVTESGIPVWLRQLQAQQQGGSARPGVPAASRPQPPSGAAGLQPGSLISEDALPAWLRNDANPPQSGAAPGGGPAAWGVPQGAPQGAVYGGAYGPGQPGPAPQYVSAPSGGGAAGLIDESGLPAWLRQSANGQGIGDQGIGGQGAAYGPGQPPYPPAYPAGPGAAEPARAGYPTPGGNMTAGSLIDERALPSWMNQPNSAGRPAAAASGSVARREGMDARSLVDDTSLPQWLRGAQQGGLGQEGQWDSAGMSQEPLPAWLTQSQPGLGQPAVAQPSQAQSHPLPPSDDSALPEWLRGQGTPVAPGATPLNPAAMPAWVRAGSAAAESRFSASSAGASGAWNQGGPGQRVARQPANSAWLTDAHVPAANDPGGSGVRESELPPWLRSAQQVARQQPNGQAGGLAGDELPPWLRQGGPDPRAGGSPAAPGASSGRGRVPQDQRPADARDFSRSGVRGNDPRQPAGYAGHGYPNEYGDDGDWDEGNAPEEYDQEWEGERRHRERRHGLFGFLRRR